MTVLVSEVRSADRDAFDTARSSHHPESGFVSSKSSLSKHRPIGQGSWIKQAPSADGHHVEGRSTRQQGASDETRNSAVAADSAISRMLSSIEAGEPFGISITNSSPAKATSRQPASTRAKSTDFMTSSAKSTWSARCICWRSPSPNPADRRACADTQELLDPLGAACFRFQA